MSTRQEPLDPTPATPIFRRPRVRGHARDEWNQLMRFCTVGASGYVVNLAVFWTLIQFAGAHHLLAAAGAFLVAWTNNFVLNKFWTFRRHELSAAAQGARNMLVSLAALSLNLVLLETLVRGGSPELPAQALAIALVTPVNFLLNRRWSFR
ncbi:MAG: GtrA family protein [Miltoncostaeaceae bacterium]